MATSSPIVDAARALVRTNLISDGAPVQIGKLRLTQGTVIRQASKELAGRVECDEDVHVHKYAYNTGHPGNNWDGNPLQGDYLAAEADVAQAVAKREAADEQRGAALVAQVRLNRILDSTVDSQRKAGLAQQAVEAAERAYLAACEAETRARVRLTEAGLRRGRWQVQHRPVWA